MKIALIIGGTSGIGNGIATALSLKGIKTFVVGRHQHDDTSLNLNSEFIQSDLTSENSSTTIIGKLSDVKLDYLIFSAATETPLKQFSKITGDEYQYAFDLNLKVPFFLTQALISKFNDNARILFLTSRLSSSPEVGSLIYCMTKSAIEIFSAGINKEFPGKILASSIIPGIVDTDMQKRLREADPTLFPKTHEYQAMQPKLKPVKFVSELIVTHLCDTTNEEFTKQRVNPFDVTVKTETLKP